MGSTPARSRTAAATDARRRAAQDALGRVRDAIKQIKREKAQPSVAAVARRAGVSRSFVYDNPEARAAVSAALAEAGERRSSCSPRPTTSGRRHVIRSWMLVLSSLK